MLLGHDPWKEQLLETAVVLPLLPAGESQYLKGPPSFALQMPCLCPLAQAAVLVVHACEVATLLTDVLGHALDRDAMLRLAANVYDTLERSEQEGF